MSVVIGHPTSNPNSLQAALAYWEAGTLDRFCVPWLPNRATPAVLGRVPGLARLAERLSRRVFEPLVGAPLRQGRIGEWSRLAQRCLRPGPETERRCYAQAVSWLGTAMSEALESPGVTAVHAFEDCASTVFAAAARRGRRRILEMPTCHAAHKKRVHERITRESPEWLPGNWERMLSKEKLAAKDAEIAAADLLLVACEFAAATIRECHPKAAFGFAPYGVDADFWTPGERHASDGPLRVVFVGHVAPAKGVPTLLEAWRRAQLGDAELRLAGYWSLSDAAHALFPPGARWLGPLGPARVREEYQRADLFVFPSWYEGFGLVILEAMACGLPVLCSRSSAGPDLLTPECGWLHDAGDVEVLTALLREAASDRDRLRAMGRAARERALEFGWPQYRARLLAATQ